MKRIPMMLLVLCLCLAAVSCSPKDKEPEKQDKAPDPEAAVEYGASEVEQLGDKFCRSLMRADVDDIIRLFHEKQPDMIMLLSGEAEDAASITDEMRKQELDDARRDLKDMIIRENVESCTYRGEKEEACDSDVKDILGRVDVPMDGCAAMTIEFALQDGKDRDDLSVFQSGGRWYLGDL